MPCLSGPVALKPLANQSNRVIYQNLSDAANQISTRSEGRCLATLDRIGNCVQFSQQVIEVIRQRRDKLHPLTAGGMTKTEPFGVQKLTLQFADRRSQSDVLNSFIAAPSIDFIANNRMLQPREMHANLVRAASFQFNVE